MKIIEALKQVKDLQRKADDLKQKVRKHCAKASFETDSYDNQGEKVQSWIHSHTDVIQEIEKLKVAIQRTNLETMVTIEFGGNQITKSIAAWIHRRRELAMEDLRMWQGLTDRNIREGVAKGPGGDDIEVKLVRYYSKDQRDKKVEMYSSEPSVIDGKLEIINAVTDLLGYIE